MTISELLDQEREHPLHVLVEVNADHVIHTEYERHRLNEGDVVEIILPAVGG